MWPEGDIMKPTISLDHSVIVARCDETIHALLELTAPPAPALARPPLDIALVIDRSGSMEGRPLDSVRKAVLELLRVAGANDRIAVVTFDTKVDTVLPLEHHDATAVAGRIRAIHSGGSTNLSAGWLKGVEILTAAKRPDSVARVVVLTDGHANAGVTEHDALCTMVRGATDHGVTTSLIGFADGHDENLIAALADAGRGNDYWCAGPDQALNVFTAEFAGLASVVAQNLSVEVRPTVATAAFECLNEFDTTPVPGNEAARVINIGDAYGDEVRRLALRFALRPVSTTDEVLIAELVVRWASTVGSVALHEMIIPISVNSVADASTRPAPDARVVEHVVRLEAADDRRRAIEAARHRQFDEARRLAHRAADKLIGVGADPDEVRELMRFAADIEHADEMTIKGMRSASRQTNKGRRSRFDPNNPY
jgi:Ca-activated chloride channel family protein